jgi:hypothetical protein
MTLNASGPISLGGSTTGQSINLELGQSATALASINATNFRALAGVASGQISLSNFYGKSAAQGWFTLQIMGGTSTEVSRTGGAAVTSNGSFFYFSGGGVFNCDTYYDTLTVYNSSGTQVYSKGAYTSTNTAETLLYGSYQSSTDTLFASKNLPIDPYGSAVTYHFKISSISTSPTSSWYKYFTLNVSGVYAYANVGRGLVTDSSGNIYRPVIMTQITYCCCSPIPNRAFGILKIDTSGVIQYFKYGQNPWNFATAANIALTSSGSYVYISGANDDPNGGTDAGYNLAKYDASTGALQWLKNYTASTGQGWNVLNQSCFCVDGSDNVYTVNTSQTYGLTISKVDSTGTFQSANSVNISSYLAGYINVANIIYGTDGYIYIAAQAYASTANSTYTVILKFSTSLVLQYARSIKTSTFDSSHVVTLYNVYQGNTSMSQDSSAIYIVLSGVFQNVPLNNAVITAKLLKDGSGTATGITFSGASTGYNLEYQAVSLTTTSRTYNTTTAGSPFTTIVTGTTSAVTTPASPAFINTGYTTTKTNI